jgi:hypothetical protein
MPIYIDETKRGYPDPVDWDTADYDLYGQGKGSYLFGKDEVFYIGDPEQVVISGTSSRRKVYRMYSGKATDHLYTIDEEEKPTSYNREPRNNQEYVFIVMTAQVSGSVPLYRHLSVPLSDHKYSLNASESGYTQEGIMGYVFTTYAAAQVYANTKIGEVAKPVYSYYNSGYKDSFYTLNPSVEVNLQEYSSGGLGPPYPGDDDQNPDRGDNYTYTGIMCWTFERMSGTDTRRIIEVGKPQYAGTSFLYGWLTDVNGGTAVGAGHTNWLLSRYSLIATRQFLINDQRANFTFLYGEFGPVKAALPRFINTKYLYDAQFFYYLYDTVDPWNGPLYGVRMMTEKNSLGNCCVSEGPLSCLLPDPWIYRYYYQLRPNVWKTKKSRIYTDVQNTDGVDQNILTAGTDDKIVFFRYTAGSFNMSEGDIVNGWRITEHRYMGDEMGTGFIRISRAVEGTDGSVFSYGSTYSSNNTTYPASFVALAGYGIAEKCAIFGVYEFKKRVAYYKVELYSDAAIPKRTMDEADIVAVIDDNGKVSDLIINNSGYGYSPNARVEIMPPPIENTTADIENTRTYYLKDQVVSTDETTFTWTKDSSYKTIGEQSTAALKGGVTINETSLKLKPANVEITSLSPEGCIQSLKILDVGSGYNKQEPPKVIVYDPYKYDQDNSPKRDIGEDLLASGKNSQDKMISILSSIGSTSSSTTTRASLDANGNVVYDTVPRSSDTTQSTPYKVSSGYSQEVTSLTNSAKFSTVKPSETYTVEPGYSTDVRAATNSSDELSDKFKKQFNLGADDTTDYSEYQDIGQSVQSEEYDDSKLKKQFKEGADDTKDYSEQSYSNKNPQTELRKVFNSTDLNDSIKTAFKKFDEGVVGTIYTGYIKGPGEIDPDNYFEFCLGVPTTCANPTFNQWNPLDSYNKDFFKNVISTDTTGGFNSNFNFLNTTGAKAISNLNVTAQNAGGLYGAFNPEGNLSCLKMQQPKLHKVSKFYDIPCPYTVGAGDGQKVFGYLPYQYCASKEESATFNIYIEVDGDFTGSASSSGQNSAFITKLKSLSAPKILAPREAAEGVKTWHCTRGSYDGRCFRAGDGDISFYPIGLDENVYDYTNLSVPDAYTAWIGQPSTTLSGTSGTFGGRFYNWLGGGTTTFKFTGPSQPSGSWDNYVYDASTNPNGLFFKYTGYDENGNGTGQQTRWQNYIYTMPGCEGITDIDSMIAFDPTQISINNDLVRLGPFKGVVTVKNYSTGSAIVYGQAVNNMGNPYFESCLNATN